MPQNHKSFLLFFFALIIFGSLISISLYARHQERASDIFYEIYQDGAELADQAKYNEAIKCYEKVLKLQPDFTPAYFYMGEAYRMLRKKPEAIEAFKKAILIEPEDEESHFWLGTLFFETGKRDLALKEYEILKTLDKELAEKLIKLIN